MADNEATATGLTIPETAKRESSKGGSFGGKSESQSGGQSTQQSSKQSSFRGKKISDHCPAVIKLPLEHHVKPKPFRQEVSGHALFRLVKKLRLLKKPMHKLMWCKGNIHKKVVECRAKLDVPQQELDADPFLVVKRDVEREALLEYNEVVLHEEMFLKQKSKIEWLRVGDSNSSFLNKSVKSKANKSRIQAVFDLNENFVEGCDVPKVFVEHYERFLGTSTPCDEIREPASLEEVVSVNQSAFILGRRISDNILLTQELMKNYHLDRGISRCAFKVDIQKVYDTVDWEFLEVTLICFGFPMKMVRWIMACVSSTSFSINVNGDLHGFFGGKRGLRQGDPMSPYLFTLVMEVLTLMLKRNISRAPEFKSLEEFKKCSGLVPSLPKSTAFFCHVFASMKNSILATLPFKEGRLPVRYLGVPLVPSRLVYRDCKILVERVKIKVDNWMNKFLSFAGRVQLIVSVLTAMQVYWCSVFILPDMIIKDIEKLFRGFLWCQGPMKRGKAKVKWDNVCLPKYEGGWGDGATGSAWHDSWCNLGIRSNIVTHNDIVRAGWNEKNVIRDIVYDDGVLWPRGWVRRYPVLQSISAPILFNSPYKYGWKDIHGSVHEFSVSRAWNSLRLQGSKVSWYSVVWFSQCVPRHAFLLWLLLGEKLKTQGKLKPWDVRDGSIQCNFSAAVWSKVQCMLLFDIGSNDWRVIVDQLTPVSERNLANVLVAKLCFAAAVYAIWQERNYRLFKHVSRTEQQVFQAIVSNTRLKMMTIRFKTSSRVARIRSMWNLEEI
ncbi:uncharacterized protein [Rutidosis leptorrhynchoides]|uniref:uncharacterized protein n=1 Tax=Rutidosis leptorrhynchoides TaxID=125765 RepID=UPI003A99A69C